jgi:hypothetical protein
MEYFDTDFPLATVVEQHQAFYRRVFGFTPWCEPRDYPKFNFKVACMGLDFGAVKERVEARYPFFRSTDAEREALFGRRPRRTHMSASPEGWLRAMAG